MPALPDRRLSRAVLIGTSDFEHDDRLPTLPAVRQNLTNLSHALTDPDTGVLGWEQCSLIDTPDSPASFMGRLQKIAKQAEDLLLVYYAGHGIRHPKRDDLYLTVRQTDPDGLDGTGVPFEWVREAIEHSPARTRLLILDCCYSGMALGSMSSGSIDAREVQITGTAVITSSPRNKISHSPPGERLTAFTGELVTLLIKGPRVTGEPLTVHTLYRGLVAAMANRQLPQPKMKAGDLSADLLLRRSSVKQERPATRTVAPTTQLRLAPSRQKPVSRPQPAFPPRHAADVQQTPVQATAVTSQGQPSKSNPKSAQVTLAIGRLALWITLALFLNYTIGGIVGYFFGVPPSGGRATRDLELALVTAVIAAICVGVVWLNVMGRRRRGNSTTIAGDLQETIAATLARLPAWLLYILASFFAIFATVGILVESSSSSGQDAKNSISSEQGAMSSLAVSVTLVLWLLQLAAGCIYALHRRHRHRSESQ